MANEEFERLIKNRKDWVRSSKENKFDFDSILAGLYNDPSHFIYEILQNAEDVGAKKVRFELFEDRLDVYHNGEKDFDLRDIEGVTGIGISTKKDNLNLIGKFGVGFKSVFAVTETPHIFSGEFKIKIEDFVIPSVINSSNSISGTLIRLPLNHKMRSPQEVFTLIANKLEKLGFKTLLFLKNIKEITWQTPSSQGRYLKSSNSLQNIPNAKKETIISSNSTEEYIVIERPIKLDDKELKVEVAYKIGKDSNSKEIIVQEPDSKLVVFFPTEKVTFLNFVIQGPYKTTPNRENIPLDDEQNRKIIDETACLVSESLSVVRDLGYFDTNFLSLLPINSEHKKNEQIYSVIYEKVKEKFLIDELLPTSDGKYTKAGDAILARGKELTKFLKKDDIQKLFSKKNWLDVDITSDRKPELRDYLIKELGVLEVDFDSFAKKITANFFKTKPDEWMIDFYSGLSDRSDKEKNILKTKPIIRLENGEHIAPFENGKVQVYLPAETKTQYKTVKHTLIENENSLRFLKALGLTEPDLFAEVNEFILTKYKKDNPTKDEGYFEDFEKLLKAYETVPSNKKREFTEELSKLSFIDSVNNVSGENCLCKPSKIYLPDEDLKNYFDGYNSVYFISSELNEKLEEGRLKPFFIDLGVEDKPRRIEIKADLSLEEKRRLRGNNDHTKDIHQKDYEYEGLDNFIKQMTINKSCLLWKLLLKNIETLQGWDVRRFFEGEYGWSYYKEHSKSFEAKFTKTLKQQAWLADKNNNFRKPSEITFSELSDDYIKESSNIDILIKALKFKPEIIDQLPEADKKILEIAKKEGITPEKFEKLISERKKKSLDEEEKTWTPKHEPNAVSVKIIEVEPDKIVTPDLSGQGEKIDTGKYKELPTELEKLAEEDVDKPQPDRKAIGKWGEGHIYHALNEEYQKLGAISETDSGFKVINSSNEELVIVWLNKHSDRGKGYDFVVKKNGTEIEYIEVKTKIQEDAELIEVTGTQWEFARRLFEQGEGEKYSFYVVLNAGKDNAEIHIRKNPIKLWKEGKLYAHPVNFKL